MSIIVKGSGGGAGGEDLSVELNAQATLIREIEESLVGKISGANITPDTILKGYQGYKGKELVVGTRVLEGEYVWKKLTAQNGEIIGYVSDNDPEKYPAPGEVDGYWYELYGTPVKIVTWSGGTDEEILAMIAEARKGYLKLSDYWAVGDTRAISVSAMSASGVGESHANQQVNIVISEFGGKTLEDGTECLLQYDFANCLAETGYINSSNNNTGGYESCARKTWCDNVCFPALPAWLQTASKRFKTKTFNGGTTTTINDGVHKLALRTEMEVLGARAYSHANEVAVNTQPTYYKANANRIKTLGVGGSATLWLTGSAHNNVSSNWCVITTAGAGERQGCSMQGGIAPYGCI